MLFFTRLYIIIQYNILYENNQSYFDIYEGLRYVNVILILIMFNCSVCYEQCENQAIMPCCNNPNSTLRYCTECISIICESPPGRCPTCRAYIKYENGIVTNIVHQDPCNICKQTRTIVDERRLICEACMLGMRYCFKYECEVCHHVQRIPHPMWKYQPKPSDFTNDTWACNTFCHRQTRWRIVPEQAILVPPEHCPDTWGRREEWLLGIREERRRRSNRNQINGRCASLRSYTKYVFIIWFCWYVYNGSNEAIIFERKIQISSIFFILSIIGIFGVRYGFV